MMSVRESGDNAVKLGPTIEGIDVLDFGTLASEPSMIDMPSVAHEAASRGRGGPRCDEADEADDAPRGDRGVTRWSGPRRGASTRVQVATLST
jgi:hypothetical protein